MLIDLHNHTVRCNHAQGSVEEYVQQAIAQGVDVYGFSDHAPMDFDPKYRMAYDEMEAYEADILKVKEKYSDHIEVLLGYEVDYIDGYVDAKVLARPVDYFIGSVHFIDEWGFDNPEFIGGYQERGIDEIWQSYFNAMTKMATSKQFDIVGHLDLLKVFKYLPKTDMVTLARDALDAIKEANMVVEINPAGWRKPIGEQYPSRSLLEKIYQMEIPITFGSDAHAPKQVGYKRTESYAIAREIGYKKCAVFRNREMELVNF